LYLTNEIISVYKFLIEIEYRSIMIKSH